MSTDCCSAFSVTYIKYEIRCQASDAYKATVLNKSSCTCRVKNETMSARQPSVDSVTHEHSIRQVSGCFVKSHWEFTKSSQSV